MRRRSGNWKIITGIWISLVLALHGCGGGDSGGGGDQPGVASYAAVYSGQWVLGDQAGGERAVGDPGTWSFAVNTEGEILGRVYDDNGNEFAGSGQVSSWAGDFDFEATGGWNFSMNGGIILGDYKTVDAYIHTDQGMGVAEGDDRAVSDRKSLSVTVMHVNDTHTNLEAAGDDFDLGEMEIDYDKGGYARQAAMVKQVRLEKAHTLLLHAGDAIQGSLYGALFKGESDIAYMNYIDFDVMVAGNHEFDFGPAVLAERIDQAEFPFLGANIDAENDPDLQGKLIPYTVAVVNGQAVGIIGLVTPMTANISSPGPNVTFEDQAAAAERYIKELEGMGVNKIVLLTHLGYTDDISLAQAVSGIDVIVGGHSHTLLADSADPLGETPEGPYPTMIDGPSAYLEGTGGGKVCVVQAWENDFALGMLDLVFDENGRVTSCTGGSPILVDNFTQGGEPVTPEVLAQIEALIGQNPNGVRIVSEDPDTADFLQPYIDEVEQWRSEVIGQASETIDGEKINRIPKPESEGGNPAGHEVAAHVCRGMLNKARANNIKADIALQNAGGVRTSLHQGNITVADAFSVLPFGNTIFVLQLTGAELKQAIEGGVETALRAANASTGAFPYMAAARYEADSSLPAGQRVTSLQVETDGRWEDYNPTAAYTIVTNNFIATGGDEYEVLEQASAHGYDTGFIDNVVFIEYVENQGALSVIDTNVNLDGLNPF